MENKVTPKTIRCKNEQPYTDRIVIDEFKFLIYNGISGHVVAATYSPEMAAAILRGISATPDFRDIYLCTTVWEAPEPMV